MNTEAEYQLIKETYELVKNDKFLCKTEYVVSKARDHHLYTTNKHKALKDLKVRLFKLSINLRSPADPQDNYNEVIKQLKHNPLNEGRNLFHQTYRLREKDMVEILLSFRFKCKKIDEPPYYKGQRGPYMNCYKGEALQDMLNQNNIEWKKTWNVKKLMDSVIKM